LPFTSAGLAVIATPDTGSVLATVSEYAVGATGGGATGALPVPPPHPTAAIDAAIDAAIPAAATTRSVNIRNVTRIDSLCFSK